ncbi:SDR family NAD(P)-dependent oxidoreductase [Pseudovibrio sp. WM33]|uniref:SDR family NAD(P)-dependent oxidoreductase n=1 Tax=Pseudovibrio sp. WM33 TaxID=1735585 RepID=UPI0007AE5629|nr:SDR family NAD(P)-dependent oxidoreductase [Pseudovibrio sp. WM33]KZL25218.1 3-oxoacyl-[acyl-carrier-protein] reductase FabG [Pseudovibrio sp. WM33]
MKKAKAIPVPPPPGYLEEWRATNNTCLVTGATDGIGRALAIRLADAGQTLVIVGRSKEKVSAVLKDVGDAGPHRSHRGFVADLSLISEVDRLADEISQKLPDLSRIVLCAAETPGFRGITGEGIEAGFAVIYLSRFQLLNKLTPLLKQQQAPRIVSFASPVTKFERPDTSALNDPDCTLDSWDRRTAHTNCNLLFLMELAEQLKNTDICINAFGPGLVLTKQMQGYSVMRRFCLGMKSSLVGKSAPYAALPAMHMLLSPDFADKTGGFYECGTKIPPDKQILSKEIRQQFWTETSQLVHLAQANKG